MLRFYDPEGIFSTASYEGYPYRVLQALRPWVRWYPGNLDIPVEMVRAETLVVWCGPPAPRPLQPTPQEILDGARWAYGLDLGNG